MLGDELSRESQMLLHAAGMRFVLPPDVYAIAQADGRDCYFITAADGVNALVGCPAYNEDVADALDALGGISVLLAEGGDTAGWREQFGCTVIRTLAADQQPLGDDLLALQVGDTLALLYQQHGGVLCGHLSAAAVDTLRATYQFSTVLAAAETRGGLGD